MNDKKIKVGLVQIGDKFGEQYYLPYSIATLQAYAQSYLKNPESFSFLLPIYKRLSLNEAVRELQPSQIIFFSAYVWNYALSLAIAKKIKQNNPETIIVFGGPQIPEEVKALEFFLRENPFVDLTVYGEGEIPVLKILENFKTKDWKNVPSVGFIGPQDKFSYNQKIERISKLDQIPSAYLSGVFEPLLKANPNEEWSALLETNRGCPYACSYCYWGKKERSKVYQFDCERVFKEIDWFSRHKIQFVFCCDANFGLFKRDLDIALKVSQNKNKYGYPQGFSVQNTKNSSADIFNLQKVLTENGLQRGVNLALQSVNPQTLKSINRNNIPAAMYKELQTMFSKENIPTFSDIIIGLPEETYESFTEGVSEIIASGQHNRIQFINLAILENSQMAEKAYQEKYGLAAKEIKSIAHHTSLNEDLEVSDTQKLVVATKAMPAKDWVRTRVFSWMVSLLYFNKLLQIPFLVLNKLSNASAKELAEAFIDEKKYPMITRVVDFFREKAKAMQAGGNEFVAAPEYLNIWWPADEYMFIKLCLENFDEFYRACGQLLREFIAEKKIEFADALLVESLALNRALIKLPGENQDLEINCAYNLYDFYQSLLKNEVLPLRKVSSKYLALRSQSQWDLADWLREVVWYGTKRGAYLYECRASKITEVAV